MKTVKYSELDNLSDLRNELSRSRELAIQINHKQANRIKLDWDKFYEYKFAYAQGKKRFGHWKTFIWILNNIFTSLFYGELEKVTGLYYDCYQKLRPVEFSGDNDEILVIFRVK